MTSPALFSRVVLARIGLTTVVMLPIFGGWVIYERGQEREATQRQLDQKQAQIDAAQAKLDKEVRDTAITRRGLVALSNRVKLSSCQEANRRARTAVEEAVRRDYTLANTAIGAGVSKAAVNAFVAADVRIVRRANPMLDCSPAAIGLQPLPPVPPKITASRSPPPLVSRAGTTVVAPRRQPTTTTAVRHGQQRRPPHPRHP